MDTFLALAKVYISLYTTKYYNIEFFKLELHGIGILNKYIAIFDSFESPLVMKGLA